MHEIDDRLRELRRALRALSRRRRQRALDEARDHLLSAIDDGLSPREAVARLGDAPAFAGFPPRRRTHRLTLIVVPVAMLALVPSVGGTLQRLGAGTTPSRAAVPPKIPSRVEQRTAYAVRQCVASWNSAPSARWRKAAVAGQIRRAQVGISYTGRVEKAGQRPVERLAGCTVVLQPARVASPYQPRILVYGNPDGTHFHFVTLRRSRVRSAAQATNARLDAAGRITLSARTLHATCPSVPIGSAVEALHAGGSGGSSLAIVIRNEGAIAIQGAIASVDVASPARPKHPSWRSGPKIIPRLEPGASATVHVEAEMFGPGTRLLRVTSAAVECETRLGDNSRTFRIHVG